MIDRSLFTPSGDNPDCAVPFGEGKTIPTEAVASMIRDLLETSGSVMEIGTGSGYQAAILAESCASVLSVEKEPDPKAAERLPANVTLVEADGMEYDSGEQFDGILVTFAAPRIVPVWMKQLKMGAKLVVPIKLESSKLCRICVYERRDYGLQLVRVHAYAPFVEAK